MAVADGVDRPDYARPTMADWRELRLRRAFAPEIARFSERAPGLSEQFRSLRDTVIRHAERQGSQQRNNTGR